MKRKIAVGFVCILIVIAALAGVFYPMLLGRKPFRDLRAADIANVSVRLVPPDQTVQVTDVNEFVEALNNAVIYGRDNSYTKYGGQAVIFTIVLKDGNEIVVNAYNPFLIIDGVGYKTKYEPCEKLSEIANSIAD